VATAFINSAALEVTETKPGAGESLRASAEGVAGAVQVLLVWVYG
jgi:hypothetical protein